MMQIYIIQLTNLSVIELIYKFEKTSFCSYFFVVFLLTTSLSPYLKSNQMEQV